MHIRVLRLVLSGLMGALLVVSKQAMSGLPNIEPVTLLVILFALELPRETPGAVTVFILLQGVLYGFGLWWAMYLYVWYLLALLAWLLRRMLRRPVCGGVSGGKNSGLCPELVAQRPFLRCHARRGKFCHHAAALPPPAQSAADSQTADPSGLNKGSVPRWKTMGRSLLFCAETGKKAGCSCGNQRFTLKAAMPG